MSRCNYWDCGWCYAPDTVEINAEKVLPVLIHRSVLIC